MARRKTSLLRVGAVAAGIAAIWSAGLAQTQSGYPEPTPEDMADALAKNQDISNSIFFTFMFDPVRARRCGFADMKGLRVSEGQAILRRCLKVKKQACTPGSRGYVCGFQMILGIDGWEDAQDPGRGRFFKDDAGAWAASGG